MTDRASQTGTGQFDIVVIGAGFAGLYALHRFRGMGYSVKVLEAGDGIGGTWFWNRYPGARCDIESLQYSYSFSEELEREWRWSERFATQPEILDYINFVADKFDLRRDIQFDARVAKVAFDDADNSWTVTTEAGEAFTSRFVVTATGCLSAAKMPEIPGIDRFTGTLLHTGNWPKAPVDFTGKRVVVIGTGSSGIQAIPEIAKAAAHLTVIQRTPHFSVPARNAPLSDEARDHWAANHKELRRKAREEMTSGVVYEMSTRGALTVEEDERQREYETRWAKGGANFLYSFNDLMLSEDANATAADFVRGKISDIVGDPEVAARLTPTGYPIGTKRICVDTDYYATFNRDNVELVSILESGAIEITDQGVATANRNHACDILVLATGFDAISGPLLALNISGRNGLSLREKWKDGAGEYLGLMGAGFPNLFTITGPGSPSVLSNVIVSIEQHVDLIAECLRTMSAGGFDVVEADAAAEAAWMEHVNEIAHTTLYPRANSWYVGANVVGKPRRFLPYIGVHRYREKCTEIVRDGFRGFHFTRSRSAASDAA